MLSGEFEQTLHTITVSKNPEIYHFLYGSHPGVKWYIKTILPGYNILTNDSYPLWAMWRHLAEHHSDFVKIVNTSYDWDGKLIPNWWTIWLDQRIDIVISWSREHGFNWKIVDYDIGLKLSADDIYKILSETSDNRQPNYDSLHYKQLCYIIEYLKTYTTEKRSKSNRKKLKVIENAKISDETTDNN